MAKPFKITFCGDTSLGYYYLEKGKNKYPEAYERLQNDPFSFFEGVAPLLEGSDEVIVNLETVLTKNPGQPIEGKEYPGCDDPEVTIEVLKKLGVTAVNLANNHAYDYGKEGLDATVQHLEESGIPVMGVGKNSAQSEAPYCIPVVIDGVERNVYIFSGMRASKVYHEKYGCFSDEGKSGIADAVSKSFLKSIFSVKERDPDCYVIAVWHRQGADYSLAGKRSVEISKKLIESGADCVVSHGTHTIGQMELLMGKPVFYSIGNFVFNSPGGYVKKSALPYSGVLFFEARIVGGSIDFFPYVAPIFSDNKASSFRPRKISEIECKEIEGTVLSQPAGGEEAQVYSFYRNGSWCLSMYKDFAGEIDGGVRRPLANLHKGEPNVYSGQPRFSTNRVISEELEKRGVVTEKNGRYLMAYSMGRACATLETETSFTSLLGARVAKDKDKAKYYLERSDVKVSKGKSFGVKEKELAREWVKDAKFPMVVKPSHGNKGKGVTVGVDHESFDMAWELACSSTGKNIIIEEAFLNGEEARYLVVDGSCVAVSFRIPPLVVGDGKKSVADLIDQQNAVRKENPNTGHRPIVMDDSRLARLRRMGIDLQEILPEGKEVYLDDKANISAGASAMDITNRVHPGMRRVAEKAATCFPGLDVIGVDILAHNHLMPPNDTNYVVVEINTRPGIGGHHYPAYGSPVNVAGYIASYLVRKLSAD